jgi:hypothetical protein
MYGTTHLVMPLDYTQLGQEDKLAFHSPIKASRRIYSAPISAWLGEIILLRTRYSRTCGMYKRQYNNTTTQTPGGAVIKPVTAQEMGSTMLQHISPDCNTSLVRAFGQQYMARVRLWIDGCPRDGL